MTPDPLLFFWHNKVITAYIPLNMYFHSFNCCYVIHIIVIRLFILIAVFMGMCDYVCISAGGPGILKDLCHSLNFHLLFFF